MVPTLASDFTDLVPILAISVGGGIAITAIVLGVLKEWLVAKDRERSRREIAAYIAEGSISVDEGERLMAAGRKKGCKDWA